MNANVWLETFALSVTANSLLRIVPQATFALWLASSEKNMMTMKNEIKARHCEMRAANK